MFIIIYQNEQTMERNSKSTVTIYNLSERILTVILYSSITRTKRITNLSLNTINVTISAGSRDRRRSRCVFSDGDLSKRCRALARPLVRPSIVASTASEVNMW